MSTVIRVENLSKKYTLHHERQERYTALRDVIMDKVRGVGRTLLSPFGIGVSTNAGPADEDFWALRDVSFDIRQGDRVGIIGRNGAGKSTLLKILSRITDPSDGEVKIKGRVASLLEVGTGFHPELTGRENIFLNGAILGMSRVEIVRKFDEIVEFAEVERFLDTPVKRYSSGMYVRLAFAVAAHLEPEILVVDEVLAVGDAQFQKKCLGKMEDVGREGRTVIFVSHNMDAVKHLCSKAMVLSSGRIVGAGDVEEQVSLYLRSDETKKIGCENSKRFGGGITLRRFEFTPSPVTSHAALEFVLELHSTKSVRIDALTILVYSSLGARVAVLDLRHPQGGYGINSEGTLLLAGNITSLPLVDGTYNVGLYVDSGELRDNFYDLIELSVVGCPPNNGIAPYPASARGYLDLDFTFEPAVKEGI